MLNGLLLAVFKIIGFTVLTFYTFSVGAQVDSGFVDYVAPNGDSLPFGLHTSKRMTNEDIANKKEGWFFTGYPRFEYDPIRGFSTGAHINFFHNKTKDDPLFYYSTYRHMITLKGFVFQNGRVGIFFNYDAPFIFNTRWRLRFNAFYRINPGERYYGIGRSTLDDLEFSDKSQGSYGSTKRFTSIDDYEDNLDRIVEDGNRLLTDAKYNIFRQDEQMFNMIVGRVFLDGRLNLVIGYEATFNSFTDYSGDEIELTVNDETVTAEQRETLISKEKNSENWQRLNLNGFNSETQFTSMILGALVWDTRDLEADPGEGILLEYSHEYTAPWIGSDFNFHKMMFQGQYFQTLLKWKDDSRRLTFAGAASLSYIAGSNINFIELFDISRQTQFTDKVMALGGEMSLRGYRESRFLAPTIAMINLELRSRLYDFSLFKQDIGLGLSPFYDLGNVWDHPSKFNFKKWRGAPGLGLRISWNQSSIFRFDYAKSTEGSQLFLGSGFIF